MKLRLALPAAAVVLAAVLGWAFWRSRASPTPVALTPSLTGQTEYCLTCHQGIEQNIAAHPTAAFGCVVCHGGERLALDKTLAHSTLRGGANPSDLSVVQQNCGGDQCHSGTAVAQNDHIARMMTSVQVTYAGAIANVYYAFGAQPDLTTQFGILAVAGKDPAGQPHALAALPPANQPVLQQFGANCLTCHPTAPAKDAAGYQPLTGCAACHSLSNIAGTYTGTDPSIARNQPAMRRRTR
jgi:hypothetical protein